MIIPAYIQVQWATHSHTYRAPMSYYLNQVDWSNLGCRLSQTLPTWTTFHQRHPYIYYLFFFFFFFCVSLLSERASPHNRLYIWYYYLYHRHFTVHAISHSTPFLFLLFILCYLYLIASFSLFMIAASDEVSCFCDVVSEISTASLDPDSPHTPP